MIVLTTRKQQIVEEYGINTTFTEEQMKDTVKTLMIVAGVGFTLIAITWIGMIATLLIAWIGGNI